MMVSRPFGTRGFGNRGPNAEALGWAHLSFQDKARSEDDARLIYCGCPEAMSRSNVQRWLASNAIPEGPLSERSAVPSGLMGSGNRGPNAEALGWDHLSFQDSAGREDDARLIYCGRLEAMSKSNVPSIDFAAALRMHAIGFWFQPRSLTIEPRSCAGSRSSTHALQFVLGQQEFPAQAEMFPA